MKDSKKGTFYFFKWLRLNLYSNRFIMKLALSVKQLGREWVYDLLKFKPLFLHAESNIKQAGRWQVPQMKP